MATKSVVLGELKRIDLRDVWSDEAREFTPWLAKQENLVLLSRALGDVELELGTMEVPVGTFKSDIVAMDTITNGRVIIENQLEKTNHDHLGKIITYASGLDARIIIWIAREFTEEHRQAVDFLNEQATPDLRIYGIEMKLFRIGNSEPAPEFSVVARPNEYVAQLKSEKRGLSEAKVLYKEFWTEFRQYCEKEKAALSLRKPQSSHWIELGIGRSGFHLSLTASTTLSRIGCELYLSGLTAKNAFKQLQLDKKAIEKETGPLEWQELPEGVDCRIALFRKNVAVKDRGTWPSAFEWLRVEAELFTKVFGPRVRVLKLES